MINQDSLLKIKKGASIVNTSRGEIVDEEEIASYYKWQIIWVCG